MRIRYKPYARPELAAWPQFVDSPREARGHWSQRYADPSLPLYLELGCGKGGFIAQQALKNPGVNFLGIDLKSEVLVVGKRTAERLFAEAERPVANLLLTACDIEKIGNILASADTVSRIYINFCNPWDKSGHEKHRLTHPRQLIQYRDFLPDGGEIWFKTDSDSLFTDSLRYFPYAGFEVCWKSLDLHINEPEWNIRTEHEQMFSEQGIPIKACIAKKNPAFLDKVAISRSKKL